MAVLTSGEFAMVRAIFTADSSSAAPTTRIVISLRRAFAVARDLLGQIFHHQAQRLFHRAPLALRRADAGRAVSQQHDNVVRGHVAIDAEPVEACAPPY